MILLLLKLENFQKKQKELADSQIKIVELNIKLENFQNSEFTMNHVNDVRGLGYDSVPPPFNENYSFLQHDDSHPSAKSKSETLPETVNSSVINQLREI